MDARTSARPSGTEDLVEVDDERRKWLKRVSRRCSQRFCVGDAAACVIGSIGPTGTQSNTFTPPCGRPELAHGLTFTVHVQ